MAVSDRIYTTYLIVQWIALSSVLILLNKHILSTRGFDFPVTLVLLHMTFCSLCALLWRLCGWVEVPRIETLSEYCARFVPVGLCFAASLSLGNAAYMYISVAFIQMIKASTPVATLVVSLCFGLERPSWRLAFYIALVSSGIFVSCAAQINPSVPGVVLQLSAIACEAVRLCLVNVLLTARGLKLSPIASLSFIAPICAACLLPPWCLFEAPRLVARGLDAFAAVGATTFAANLGLAFLLNVATMALIKQTSALTLNVAGVIKDLLLIAYSVMVSGAAVSPVQYSGYAVAFVGVTAYSHYKRSLAPPPPVPAAAFAKPEGEAAAKGEQRSLLGGGGADDDDGDEEEGHGAESDGGTTLMQTRVQLS